MSATGVPSYVATSETAPCSVIEALPGDPLGELLLGDVLGPGASGNESTDVGLRVHAHQPVSVSLGEEAQFEAFGTDGGESHSSMLIAGCLSD